MEAGLPDAIGYMKIRPMTVEDVSAAEGAFVSSIAGGSETPGLRVDGNAFGPQGGGHYYMSLADSNPVYGSTETVVPLSLKTKWFIKY